MSTFGAFTVTRASTKNVLGSNGLYQSVANDVPAFEFNSDGTYRGLLVEPAATNLTNRSEDFSDAYWTKTNITVTANSGSAPNGATTADTIASTSTSAQIFRAGFSLASGTTHTFSCYVQNINFASGEILRLVISNNVDSERRLAFNLAAGTGTTAGSGANLTLAGSSVQALPNGWYRISISATSGSTVANAIISLQTEPTGRSYRAWGAQFEAGSVATSYIPTVASTASRVADSVTLTGASALIGATEGTLYAEVVLKKNTTGAVLSINDGTGTNRLFIQFFSSTQLLADIRVSGVNHNYTATIPAIPANGGIFKVALAYKENDFCFALNGTTYASTASRSVPATTQIDLANHIGGVQLNDNIRSAVLYKERLPNATLAALTA